MAGKDFNPYYKVVSIADPAAGSDFTITALTGELWRVVSLRARFVASAAVANRQIELFADDGTGTFFGTTSAYNAVATTDHDVCAFAGAPNVTLTNGVVNLALPIDGIPLQPGWRLRSQTNAIDVADQFSLIRVLVEAFPIGSGNIPHAVTGSGRLVL